MTTGIDPHLILHQLFSPAFPVGAFAWSHGLEAAIADGDVTGAASLQGWLTAVLTHGAGWSDAVLLSLAARGASLAELDDLARAMTPSAARRRETAEQGAAFAATANAVWGLDLPELCYPVAVGGAVRALDLPHEHAVRLLLQSFLANLTSAGVRLIPLGQTDGQKITAALGPLCVARAAEAALADLDDIGTFSPLIDIHSQRQEALQPRIFRS
ncbi:urease accessory protein UreF [Allosediminivita pacifica]|uniref:Urease accessory protein UreF n=1 Tax=Allosediminivita pacifica TaxID=1267769 RepID=A0A2T6ATT6_9RHOB|nr:urease accessory UreF family protein [Allosediminivita pacifica]PTX47136.1 urease accessory protein [Allosediminivita pacifica]